MTASTQTTSAAAITDVDVVRALFGVFAGGDLAALSGLLTPTRPGITTTRTASAGSTAAPMRSPRT